LPGAFALLITSCSSPDPRIEFTRVPPPDAKEYGAALVETEFKPPVTSETLPRFWQSWWFRVGVISSLVVAAFALYRLRLRQLRTQLSLRFEERLEERTRVAQDLHDTLLQGFVSASLRLHVVADGLPDDSPLKPQLSEVQDLMRRVIDEGRNAVRGMRSLSAASQDLEHAFSRVREELGIKDDVGFRVIVNGHARPLSPILRDEIYRVGREAIVNAVRHSSAKNIEVELEYTEKQLRVVVRDDGRGIDPQVLRFGREGHFGLTGMREGAERIGGRLQVYSAPMAGTEVELSVSSRLAFESESPSTLKEGSGRL
jgi:signal transduction histidine kinase